MSKFAQLSWFDQNSWGFKGQLVDFMTSLRLSRWHQLWFVRNNTFAWGHHTSIEALESTQNLRLGDATWVVSVTKGKHGASYGQTNPMSTSQ